MLSTDDNCVVRVVFTVDDKEAIVKYIPTCPLKEAREKIERAIYLCRNRFDMVSVNYKGDSNEIAEVAFKKRDHVYKVELIIEDIRSTNPDMILTDLMSLVVNQNYKED